MRMKIQAGLAAVALTLAFTLPSIATTSTGDAQNASAAQEEKAPPPAPPVGEVVNYKFRTSPMNSAGAKELADFRGRPLLIEYWGIR